MKKRITSLLLTIIILLFATVTAFAASPKLMFESSFDADTGLVSVSVFISNAEGIEAGDLALAFDNTKLSFVESSETSVNSAMVIGGLSVFESDICSCSFVFTEKCMKEDLDENGNLALATYKFKPITENYDDDDFCFFAQSLVLNGNDVAGSVEAVGNKTLSENRAGGVRVDNGSAVENVNAVDNDNDDSNTDAATVSKVGSNWYIYVLAVALAIGAIVGIALVAVKGGEKNSEVNDSDENHSDSENSVDKDDENTESAD